MNLPMLTSSASAIVSTRKRQLMARSLVDYIDSISQRLHRLSILVSTWHDLMSFANKFWLKGN